MKTVFLLSLVLLSDWVSMAQTPSKMVNAEPKTTVSHGNCEENTRQLSVIAQYTPKEDLIIIISHASLTEKKEMGRRRLGNSLAFFNKGASEEFNRPLPLIITAEGEAVKGNGYVDYYVNGKLELRLYLPKNRDLAIHFCVTEPEVRLCSRPQENLYYPCRKD